MEGRHEGGFEPRGLKKQEGPSWASDAQASIQTDPRGAVRMVREFLEAELREGHPEMETAAGRATPWRSPPTPRPGTRRVGTSRSPVLSEGCVSTGAGSKGDEPREAKTTYGLGWPSRWGRFWKRCATWSHPAAPRLVTASLCLAILGLSSSQHSLSLMLLSKAMGPRSRGPSAAMHPTLVHRGLPWAGRPRGEDSS